MQPTGRTHRRVSPNMASGRGLPQVVSNMGSKTDEYLKATNRKKKKPTSNEAGIHPPVSCEELTLRHHSDFDHAVLSEPRKTGKRYPSKQQQQQQQQKSQQWNLTLCQVSGTKCLLLGRNLEISSEQSFFFKFFLLLLFFLHLPWDQSCCNPLAVDWAQSSN